MASPMDSWMRDYNDASKLADDINFMIPKKGPALPVGADSQRHHSAIRRKITILRTRLESLTSLLSKLPRQPRSDKEFNKRQDMLTSLKSKENQISTTLKMTNMASREDLLGPSSKPVDEITRTEGLDNRGVVSLQRQIMKEQDEGLEQLEETVLSTKHIALTVNEELSLHTRLIDNLDQQVAVTDSRLQRVQKKLAALNKRTRRGCTCFSMLMSVLGIVGLVVVIWLLIKYL